jgi:hypothetical protein
MKVLRVASLSLTGVALLCCLAGVAVATYFAPPDDLYRVAGVALRGPGGVARLPHRGLACADDPANARLATCRATGGGQALVVTAEYEARPAWGLRACTATYQGKSATCRAGNMVVNGPLYAIIQGADLGLSRADLQSVRQQWPVENWHEADWLRVPALLAALLALGVVLVACNIPVPHPFGRAIIAGAGGLTTFLVTYTALGLYIFSLGYVD